MINMTTISIVHTKGGVGKTTTSMYLAAAAQRRGIDVAVVDTDFQGSASAWAQAVEDDDLKLPFPVIEAKDGLVIPPHDLVLVDTPPGKSEAIVQAIKSADIVLVPCGASPMDAERVMPTIKMTTGRLTLVLMTGVDLRSRLWKSVKNSLDSEVATTATVIPSRSDIKRAFGTIPTRLYAYDDLLTELGY